MFHYLALGDSYTIGEQVLFQENFPNQLVRQMREKGYSFAAPEILAKTGWTTDELQNGIDRHLFLPDYDFVSLLIGVNNQYRGRSEDEYRKDFEHLLHQALRFAGGKKERVLVLSIPDWGVTPFATNADRNKIRTEIDAFNRANRQITEAAGIPYLYITDFTREAANDSALLAADGLHPSAKEYQRWASRILVLWEAQLL